MASDDRIAHPAGAVGVIVRSPFDRTLAYRVKFNDGYLLASVAVSHDQFNAPVRFPIA
ncbi:hypothetical protein [Rubripirellula reticaptiva]|uniref:Uncharacterized protein n=1 Tax=Rubripirellula reticaptiva TaxID=2528013 RepID=A0A5C6EEM6_9BACT|nr:hypothetical protein [Rubripirellula reticaptiva]TWU46945.1 hypothetical protein Poly59_59190 [Rubripirellula reticaptiva]